MRQLVEQTLRMLEPEVPYSENALLLLLGTAAQESSYGKYRRQVGNGPALGIFQMEPATFTDIDRNYLRYHPAIRQKILSVCGLKDLDAKDLVDNDRLAVCMARVHYLRSRGKIPSKAQDMALYWKKNYNTLLGKGTPEEFMDNYRRHVENC